MNRYEILLLAVPHMTEDEATAIERGIEKIVKDVPGSSIVSYDKWGKCKLSYAIGVHEYGLYFLVRFELTDPKKVFDAIHALLTMKYSDSVIRYVVKQLAKNEPAVYVRQEIVEDAPTRDVSDFLRKNKMEGLLPSVEGGEGREGREGREHRSDRGGHGESRGYESRGTDRGGERPRYSSFNKRPRRDDAAASAVKPVVDTEKVSS